MTRVCNSSVLDLNSSRPAISSRTFKTALRKTSKPKQKTRNSKHALVVRRKIDDRGRYRETVIDITSPALCEVLLKINEGVEGLELALHQPRVRVHIVTVFNPINS